MATLLAIDDEPSVRESYRMILGQDYKILTAENGEAGLQTIEKNHVDIILLDLRMPGMGGLEVLEELARRDLKVPVLVVTALKGVSSAVEAMKRGAREYIIKPFDVDELVLMVERTLREHKHAHELELLREADSHGFDAIIGASAALHDALSFAKRAVNIDSTVLVTGESGTGKDMLARAIHKSGKRSGEPFVHVSCCAIPEALVESELFGHEKGAFTGAQERRIGKVQVADRGTLFLDEIGEMPLEAQAKLLRVLQDGEFYPVGSTKSISVDVRFVCATNRNLRKEVAQGRFREDLYYRVNVIPIEMPPLRKRREDVPLLVNFFLAKHRSRVAARATAFTQDALAKLAGYDWPGNVRELENTIERILVHNSDVDRIDVDHLRGLISLDDEPRAMGALTEFEGLPLEEATARLERHLIQHALERSGFVQSRAADMLGTTRRILKYKMDQLGLVGEEA